MNAPEFASRAYSRPDLEKAAKTGEKSGVNNLLILVNMLS